MSVCVFMFFSSNETSAWCGAQVYVHDDEVLPVDLDQHPVPHLLDGAFVLALPALDGAGNASLERRAVGTSKPHADDQAWGIDLGLPVIAEPRLGDLLGQFDGLAKVEIRVSYVHINALFGYVDFQNVTQQRR